MSLWYTDSGYIALCESGYVAETDDCPCGCPSFEGRAIAYVDKKATGTGDGSSWADAFTDIQTAIDTYPKREIQIQGYGEFDAYPAGVILADCVYLKGVDDMWVDGIDKSTNGIDGSLFESTKIEGINIKNCATCFKECNIINNCNAKDSVYGFRKCLTLSFCNVNDCFSGINNVFRTPASLLSCIVDGCSNDSLDLQNGTATNCTVKNQTNFGGNPAFNIIGTVTLVNCISEFNISIGFGVPGSSVSGTFINCISRNNSRDGFFGITNATFTDCSALNNQLCGFNNGINVIYTGCSDINNCLAWGGDCTGSGCDVV